MSTKARSVSDVSVETRPIARQMRDRGGWRRFAAIVRERWRTNGPGSVTLGVSAALLILMFSALRSSAQEASAVDAVSGLRSDLPWPIWCLRLPLSMFAPAQQLPVLGAVAQVLIVVTLGELLVGRRRLVTVAVAAHVVASLVGRLVATHTVTFGVLAPTSFAWVRDTGPSAAIVGLAVALAVASRVPALTVTITGLLAAAAVAAFSLAGVEHLVAIVVGLVVGGCWLRAGAIDAASAKASRDRSTRGLRQPVAAIVGVAGTMNVAHALAGRSLPVLVRAGFDAWPLTMSVAHPEVAAVAGLMLLIAARGLRRGQRLAWAMVLTFAVTRLLVPPRRPEGVIELLFTFVITVVLIASRRSFPAPGRMRAVRQGATVVTATTLCLGGTAALVGRALAHRTGREPYGRVLLAIVERLFGIERIVLPSPIDERLEPWLGLLGALLVGAAVWLLTRPALGQLSNDPHAWSRARRCVEEWGTDTLAWFALRDDKTAFFHADTMVAYTVKGATALVSPDPIGPPDQRVDSWHTFRAFARDNGWSTVVLGASAERLDFYLADGMHAVYIGDEAIVDVNRFSLEGGKKKGLRQAAGRVAKHGYRVTFHDPATLEPAVADELRTLSTISRRGERERGFSMTLGRFFDAKDTGMLVAVCRDSTEHAVAFCTFVPAPGIGGWSLDAMRRDRGAHPNGLFDFIIVETIAYLRTSGARAVCLNFAAMRSIVAADGEVGRSARLARWCLRRASESMQIESLWRYNAKFDPAWSARYAIFESVADIPDALAAVARAESVWELPVVGRLLARRPRSRDDIEPSTIGRMVYTDVGRHPT